jgi:hypothetical protein
MTPQQLVGLGVRLVAIWIAIENFWFLLSIPRIVQSIGKPDSAIYGYAIAGWWLIVAALLWFFPMWTAHKLLPRTRFENAIRAQPLELARVGCSVLGLWLFANQLRGSLWFLIRGAFSPDRNTSVFRSFTPDEQIGFVVSICQIAFALALIVYSAHFAALALRERRAPATESG